MTNLLMGTNFHNSIPADEKSIRNTATPYDREKPAAMQEDMPVQGEVETDPDQSVGFGPHLLASAWHQGEPVDSAAWVMPVAQVTESARIINSQVSTSGGSAEREQQGRVHRTLSYAVGIEPVQGLTENGQFGETYFKSHPRDVQQDSGSYMTSPPGFDQAQILRDAATGKVVSRQAVVGAMYRAYLDNG